MDNKTRRDKGMAYISDASVLFQQFRTKLLLKSLNRMLPFNAPKEYLIFKLIGLKYGKDTYIDVPFRCDYGKNITVGDRFYANSNCVIIDVAKVTIGDNVMFGPNVSVITAGHPVHPQVRATAYEYGIPISIGDNVWIGAGAIVLPGVTIGANTVIGAGSVVTKDIPENVVAAGNPCKVIREITDEDNKYLYKNCEFDAEAWDIIQKRIDNSGSSS